MGASDNVHTVQAIVLLLLAMVAAFAVVAQRLKVPYPIVLVIAGLGISFVPHVPRVPLDPNLVFLIFLPPLLYAAAWMTSWQAFRFNLVSIAMLAVGLVAFTVFGVAAVADQFITALDWKSGFLLGAVVATTDAIAAASIAKSIGLPKQMVEVLEGESLLNDATGLLALEFGLVMLLHGETPTVGEGLLRLLWLIAGGLGAGLLTGAVATWFERWIEDGPIEIVVSLLVPYVAYLLGEEVRSSGVLSVVACGIFLSRRSGRMFSPEARIQLVSVWQALNFALNGIVFLLIGLQLPYVLAGIRGYAIGTLLEYGAVFSAVLITLRLVWMFPMTRVAFWLRTRLLKQSYAMAENRAVFVVGWTGMRGVVSLAAAFSLPERLGDGRPFAQRNLIIFLTFAVILVTLVLQGLTLPMLIRALGLADAGDAEAKVESRARQDLLEAVIEHLQQQRKSAGAELEHDYDDLLHRYEHRLAAVKGRAAGGKDAKDLKRVGRRRAVLDDAIAVERRTMMRLRDEGRIDDDLLRRLERELDLTETRRRVSSFS